MKDKPAIPIDNIGQTDRQYEEGLPDKKDKGKKFKERINYVISNGQYCGHSVNFPIVVQAESLEKLKEQMRMMVKVFIKDIQQTLDEDAFEYIEEKYFPPEPASKEVHSDMVDLLEAYGDKVLRTKENIVGDFLDKNKIGKEQENDAVYWKKRCEAAEKVYVWQLRSPDSEDFHRAFGNWQSLLKSQPCLR